MPELVFDSSFLMAVVENPTTWFEDMTAKLGKLEAVVPECVLGELARISAGEGKRSKFARVAVDLAGSFKRAKCLGEEVDDCVVGLASRRKAMVATVDAEMIMTLKRSRTKVVTLRRGRVSIA